MVHFQPPRYGLDAWEQMMMERDRRLTGSLRGQRVSSNTSQSRLCRVLFVHELLRRPCCPSLLMHCPSQTDPVAPEGFETSSVWYTESRL